MASGAEKAETAHLDANSMSEHGSSGALPPRPKASFGQRLRAHLKKWWWLYLLAFVAIVLIVVLCVIYVGFPRLAQSGINDSSLTISALSVTNPTPSSVDLTLDSVVSSSSGFHPTLDAFNASLALAGGGAFGSILLPSLQSTGSTPVHVAQTLNITDEGAFEAYNTALLGGATFAQTVAGTTWLHQGSLPATQVTYNKTVTLNGFNNLAGFNITAFKLKSAPGADGSNAEGTVVIPNPSVLTVALGNVTFNNSVDGTPIGTSTLYNLVLSPGNNTVPMQATADQAAVLKLVSTTYKNGQLPVTVQGTSVVYNGQHLPYYEAALRSSAQKVTLNVLSALGGL